MKPLFAWTFCTLLKTPQCVVMFSPCIYATLLECPRAYVYQPRLCIFTRTFYFLLYILFHQSYHLHRHCGTIIHDQIHHFSTKALWKSPSWRTVYSRCCLNMHSFCRCHTFGLFQHVIWLCAPPMVVHVGIGQRLYRASASWASLLLWGRWHEYQILDTGFVTLPEA